MKPKALVPLFLFMFSLLLWLIAPAWAQDDTQRAEPQTPRLFLPQLAQPNAANEQTSDLDDPEETLTDAEAEWEEVTAATFDFISASALELPEGALRAEQVGLIADTTLQVTKRADTNDGVCDADCSLREAIGEAASTPDSHEIIVIPAGHYKLTLGRLDLVNADLIGAGAANTVIDGNQQFQVLYLPSIDGNERAVIEQLTIQNGRGEYCAGVEHLSGGLRLQQVVIRNNAGIGFCTFGTDAEQVTINDSRLEGNAGRAIAISENGVIINRSLLKNNHDGGIRISEGGVLLVDSTISHNRTHGNGGGILAQLGSVQVERSTISRNRAENGGGIYRSEGYVTLINSTISRNRALVDGGGLYLNTDNSPAHLIAVTLVNNRADSDDNGSGAGGGVFINTQDATLPKRNYLVIQTTIVALNRTRIGVNGYPSDCVGGLIVSRYGYNLVQTTNGCPVVGDLVGVLLGQNPRLGGLKDKGGYTHVHMPHNDSPVIDAVPLAECSATDQRGVARPQRGDHCDMGAIERKPNPDSTPSPTPTPTATPVVTPTPTATPVVKVERVSLNPTGKQFYADSGEPSISADGRWVGFAAGGRELYVYDRQIRSTTLITNSGLSVTFAATGDAVACTYDNLLFYAGQTGSFQPLLTGIDGNPPNWHCTAALLSDDGRTVAFASSATNLVAGDTNGVEDVFVYDRVTQATTRVSVSSSGEQAIGRFPFGSSLAALSADGRYVTFTSLAGNLVAGDSNGAYDLFFHDRQTGQTERIAASGPGTLGNVYAVRGSISADGRYVVFASDGSHLTSADTNGVRDIFVHDRQLGSVTQVSLAPAGVQANGHSWRGLIANDGRFVLFDSAASNLVADDTNGVADLFVYELATQHLRRISLTQSGGQADDSSGVPALSADGCHVAFTSAATNLVPNDTNFYSDVFVYSGLC